MTSKIKDEMIVEVTEVEAKNDRLHGYDQPATKYRKLTLSGNGDIYNAMRSAKVSIPGDAPIGTRFKLTIEQIDEVTPATIIRGAIPNIVEAGAMSAQLAAAPAEPAPVEPAPSTDPEKDEDIPF